MQASAEVCLRSSLPCDAAQLRLRLLDYLDLKMRPIGCPERSVTNHQPMQRNFHEKRISFVKAFVLVDLI